MVVDGKPDIVLGPRGPDALAAWHRHHVEPVLEPGLPIIDPHHHLWMRRPYRYGIEDFLADVGSGLQVVATVHVECSSAYWTAGPAELRPVGETACIAGMDSDRLPATGPRVAAGMVGFADLRLGSRVRSVLEAHLEAGRGRFRGVRVRSMREEWLHGARQPAPGLLGDAKFRAGFAQLAPLGLVYDAWLYFHQLEELADLARRFPETTIVVDHLGGPLGVGRWAVREAFPSWRSALAALARFPNVFAKIGGLGMPCCGLGLEALVAPAGPDQLLAAWNPYIQACIEAFGPSRCMFESNFPLDKQSASYVALWNTFKRATAAYSAGERAALFHGTANRVYRLGCETAPVEDTRKDNWRAS